MVKNPKTPFLKREKKKNKWMAQYDNAGLKITAGHRTMSGQDDYLSNNNDNDNDNDHDHDHDNNNNNNFI